MTNNQNIQNKSSVIKPIESDSQQILFGVTFTNPANTITLYKQHLYSLFLLLYYYGQQEHKCVIRQKIQKIIKILKQKSKQYQFKKSDNQSILKNESVDTKCIQAHIMALDFTYKQLTKNMKYQKIQLHSIQQRQYIRKAFTIICENNKKLIQQTQVNFFGFAKLASALLGIKYKGQNYYGCYLIHFESKIFNHEQVMVYIQIDKQRKTYNYIKQKISLENKSKFEENLSYRGMPLQNSFDMLVRLQTSYQQSGSQSIIVGNQASSQNYGYNQNDEDNQNNCLEQSLFDEKNQNFKYFIKKNSNSQYVSNDENNQMDESDVQQNNTKPNFKYNLKRNQQQQVKKVQNQSCQQNYMEQSFVQEKQEKNNFKYIIKRNQLQTQKVELNQQEQNQIFKRQQLKPQIFNKNQEQSIILDHNENIAKVTQISRVQNTKQSEDQCKNWGQNQTKIEVRINQSNKDLRQLKQDIEIECGILNAKSLYIPIQPLPQRRRKTSDTFLQNLRLNQNSTFQSFIKSINDENIKVQARGNVEQNNSMLESKTTQMIFDSQSNPLLNQFDSYKSENVTKIVQMVKSGKNYSSNELFLTNDLKQIVDALDILQNQLGVDEDFQKPQIIKNQQPKQQGTSDFITILIGIMKQQKQRNIMKFIEEARQRINKMNPHNSNFQNKKSQRKQIPIKRGQQLVKFTQQQFKNNQHHFQLFSKIQEKKGLNMFDSKYIKNQKNQMGQSKIMGISSYGYGTELNSKAIKYFSPQINKQFTS